MECNHKLKELQYCFDDDYGVYTSCVRCGDEYRKLKYCVKCGAVFAEKYEQEKSR